MKYNLGLISLLFISNFAMADVDYSRCNMAAAQSGARLDHDGKLVVAPWQKIKNISTKDKVEKYVIETDGGSLAYGYQIPTGMKTEVTIERDEQGRVIRMQTGPDTLDKKGLAAVQKAQLHMQLSGTVFQSDLANSNGYFGSKNTMLQEPVFFVKGENGQDTYVKLSDLTKKQRQAMGLSHDLYKDIKKQWRRDKKTVAKLEKGLKEIQEKSHPVYPIGQEANFEITDGVCTPKDMSNRMFHSKDNSVHKNLTFTKEACEDVARLHLKHKESIAKCDEVSKVMTQDIWNNSGKISVLTQNGMFAYGGGLGAMGGGLGGYAGVGLQVSTLTALKNHCDMMVGQFNIGKPGNDAAGMAGGAAAGAGDGKSE